MPGVPSCACCHQHNSVRQIHLLLLPLPPDLSPALPLPLHILSNSPAKGVTDLGERPLGRTHRAVRPRWLLVHKTAPPPPCRHAVVHTTTREGRGQVDVIGAAPPQRLLPLGELHLFVGRQVAAGRGSW